MMIGLRHAFVRAFLGVLVGIGVTAVLFRGRRPRRQDAVPVPVPTVKPRSAVPQRGLALALLGLLLGIGLILAVSGGDGALRRLVMPSPAIDAWGGPVAALAPADIGPGRARDAGADAPTGSRARTRWTRPASAWSLIPSCASSAMGPT